MFKAVCWDINIKKNKSYFQQSYNLLCLWKGGWRCINKYDTEMNEVIAILYICVYIYLTVPHTYHIS